LDDMRPMHLQIAAYLRSEAAAREVGARLPGVRQLTGEFGASLGTVAKALALLEEEGVVQKRHGKGVFVSKRGHAPTRLTAEHTIAVLTVPETGKLARDPVNWFVYADFFRGLGDAARQRRCAIDLRVADDWLEVRPVQHEIAECLIVVCFGWFPGGLEMARRWDGPAVLVDPEETPNGLISIVPDVAAGVSAGVAHLVDAGHRRIAFIGGPFEFNTQRERLAGYQNALEEAGISVDGSLVLDAKGGRAEGREAARELLASRKRPTAIACASDLRALGVLDAAQELGIDVPRDLSVVGFDDIPEAAISEPPLTTVRHPRRELGAAAAKAAVDGLAGKRGPEIRHVPVPLVRRRTVDVPYPNEGGKTG